MARKLTPKRQAEENLRFTAETYYTLSTEPVSVREMVQMEPFSSVTVKTLERWADEGQWWNKRQAHLDSLRALLQKKMASRLVQRRLEQLHTMEDIWHQGVAMLADEDLQPRNGWEGVASTVLKVGEAMDRWTVGVAQELTPEPIRGEEAERLPSNVLPSLSDEEARAAARAVVQMRRAQTIRHLPPGAEAEPAV